MKKNETTVSQRLLNTYDIAVIGAGHAGCEAALAAARMGCKTLVAVINADTIGAMSCNPAIGGLAKGHLVREIDALGGEMARNIDATSIQFRRLNTSKGPAVRSSRAQADRLLYRLRMKSLLENQENLEIRQTVVDSLLVEDGRICGLVTSLGGSDPGQGGGGGHRHLPQRPDPCGAQEFSGRPHGGQPLNQSGPLVQGGWVPGGADEDGDGAAHCRGQYRLRRARDPAQR